MFGWTRMFTLVAVASMVAVVTGGAGATSTPTLAPATASQATAAGKASTAAARRGALLRTANLNTPAGAARYLRAIGVDPRGLVIQRGARNYAGSSCPGVGWACTSTAHPVIQIAAAGGSNTFQCGTASCAVVQVSGPLAKPGPNPNTASCTKTTGLSASCSITQTGGATNAATVVEIASKMSGLTQTASYSAEITQLASGSNTNTACVNQDVSIEGSTTSKTGTPVNVTLEAHQSIKITQNAADGRNTVGGGNAKLTGTTWGCDSTALTQNQKLTSSATGKGPITQNENLSDSGPNMKIDIAQNQGSPSASGPNTVEFKQTNTLTAIANTPVGPVSQTQSSSTGGIQANVNQHSTGLSTATATQTETQCEDAQVSGLTACSTEQDPPSYAPPGLKQVQWGPVRKDADSTQTGNSADRFTITQSSTQYADKGDDQHNTVQGACTTSGYCTVSQTTTVNGEETTNTQAGQNVDTTTSCTGSTCTAPPAGITFDGSPGTAAPPSTLGPYTMTAFGTDPQPSCSDTGSTVGGVTDPAGNITFAPALHHGKTPVVGCWATWSHGYNGDVYDTAAALDKSQLTITLPAGTNAFYLYAEPNQLSPFTIEAKAQDETSSGAVLVDGNGGARYFGFYGTGGVTIATITVTTSDPDGFAVGEFGIQVAPPVIT